MEKGKRERRGKEGSKLVDHHAALDDLLSSRHLSRSAIAAPGWWRRRGERNAKPRKKKKRGMRKKVPTWIFTGSKGKKEKKENWGRKKRGKGEADFAKKLSNRVFPLAIIPTTKRREGGKGLQRRKKREKKKGIPLWEAVFLFPLPPRSRSTQRKEEGERSTGGGKGGERRCSQPSLHHVGGWCRWRERGGKKGGVLGEKEEGGGTTSFDRLYTEYEDRAPPKRDKEKYQREERGRRIVPLISRTTSSWGAEGRKLEKKKGKRSLRPPGWKGKIG